MFLCAISAAAGEPEQNTGWRGDGTGCYLAATPPTTWGRSDKGEKKNILWETKLPSYSWATPIIVGDKIFVRSEPYDLICLNKKSGKILWIRSHPAIEALAPDEKKSNPAFNEIEALVVNLKETNDALAAEGFNEARYKHKYELQNKIDDLTAKIDPKYKLPPNMWQESWGGYSGTTPCTDGKLIYFTSGNGVTAAYDLDGNKKWAKYESIAKTWGEHGSFYSVALVGDKLLVPLMPSKFGQYDVAALNAATGAQLWRQTYTKGGGMCCAILPFKSGGTEFALAFKNFIRVSDGVSCADGGNSFAGGALVQDDMAFVLDMEGAAVIYKLEPKPSGGLQASTTIKDTYPCFGLPKDKPASGPFASANEVFLKSCTSCPLYHDGLLYCIQTCGRLVVYDTKKVYAKEALCYATFPPFDFKNPTHRHTQGCGLGSSPALAGKYIYLMDNAGCTIVIEPGREYKQVAKNNIDCITPKGYEANNLYGPRQETTLSTPIFEGHCIFIRSEQNLYCIADSNSPEAKPHAK
jgi:outer membrane protein assembly factor BamB